MGEADGRRNAEPFRRALGRGSAGDPGVPAGLTAGPSARHSFQMRRRDLLRAGLAGAALLRTRLGAASPFGQQGIALIADPADPVATAEPARRALEELRKSLTDAGAAVRTLEHIEAAAPDERCVVAAGAAAPAAAAALASSRLRAPDTPESLALLETHIGGREAVLVCGADARGLVYALLELADRVRTGTPPAQALVIPAPIAEAPANGVRSVMRQFTSETLDKPWYNDRDGWTRYLGMLATHRFNRLHLAFGLGYDFLQGVTDSYLLFAYPFLVSVPGYDVRATNLPDAERDGNLEMLRFISDEAAARGLDFELGLWMHGYQLADSPHARYQIEGLTPATHAAYCRDALTAVLRACPAITAVGLRIHGESGVAEGSYDFWAAVFDGAARAGRRVELDLHAKGLDETMIERALATGLPVNVSPKYAAEHLGLPYHQAAIRDLEMPVPGQVGTGLMTLSAGARSFTRYGYADFLKEDRRYTVRPRIFSGTQRILAWGDAAFAAAAARSFGFCGMTGADLMEPLTCRGRRGTGVGRRDGYADPALAPRHDWEKYAAWYRAWGRETYDPAAEPEVFHRTLGVDERALALESALARASRILPLVTSAYLPSAACDAYWPEIYWNQPLMEEPPRNPYSDTPQPRTFAHASPLDPQLFLSPSDCADELLGARRSGKYSPLEVARWLTDLSEGALGDLARAGAQVPPERLRAAIDVRILAGLGRFFAAKLQGAVLYEIHQRTGDRRALSEALNACRGARAAWAELVERAKGVYQADLSASDRFSERGQWADRLSGIEDDIRGLVLRLGAATPSADPHVGAAVDEALRDPRRGPAPCAHTPPAGFRPSADIPLALAITGGRQPTSVRLRYRRVSQAESWRSVEMAVQGDAWGASIPGAHAGAAYPLQYYFEVRIGEPVWLYPGFTPDLLNQPYFVLRPR